MNNDNYISNKLTIANTLKKTLLLVAVSMLTILLCIINAGAENKDDFNFYVSENGFTIFEYKGTSNHLEIPPKIDDTLVVGVSSHPLSALIKPFKSSTTITSVTIPDTVQFIGDYTFYGYTSLLSITIPNSVMRIGEYALGYDSSGNKISDFTINCTKDSAAEKYAISNGFNYNYYTNEESPSVDISNFKYTVLEDGTVEITDYNEDNENTNITIPDEINGRKVTSIGENAFNFCENLTSVTITDSVTNVGNKAFYDCNNLTSVTIPNSVTSIGDRAFMGCNNLTSITIPDGVTSIGFGAFWECHNLTSITIPDSVTTIDDYAFFDCNSLTSITIPDSVTSIGYCAFYNCDSLTSVTIPDSVISIGSEALQSCESLTSITIPDSVTSIGEKAFYGCDNLILINVDANNKYYSSADGVLFNKDKTIIIQYPAGNTTKEYTIPASVTSIGENAFSLCNSLTSVTIPDSVTSIGERAFRYCDNLTIYCNKGSEAEKYAIRNDIEYSYITNNLTSPDGKFEYTELSDGTLEISGYFSDDPVVIIPSVIDGKKVTKIGMNAFKDCDYIESVTIPESVIRIDNYSFSGCTSLRRVIIENAGKNTNSLKPLNGLSNVGNKLVDNDISESYSSGLTSIGEGAFFGCSALSDITLPDSVSTIEEKAFRDCTSLTSVSFSENLTSIGDGAFFGCSSLKSAEIPESVTDIGDKAFGYYDDNGGYVTDETTIVAPKDSVAHQYAVDNNFNYAELSKNISTLTTLVIVLIVVLVIIAIGITILIVLVKKKNKVANPTNPETQ